MAVNLDKKECGYSVVYRRYTKIILRNIKKIQEPEIKTVRMRLKTELYKKNKGVKNEKEKIYHEF